jgi:uncharacterized damage-inducible protein DinB
MKNIKWSLACIFLLLCSISAFSQTGSGPSTVADVFNHTLSNAENEFVPAVEAMPEDKFNFAPANGEFKGVRTFALEARHVATVNYEFGAVILGEKSPVEKGTDENGADTLKTKADIVKYTKDSFVYLHKALATLNEQNLVTPIPNPFGGKNSLTRLGIALIAVSHPYDHYGQMVEYLRMNNLVPPASRR